MASSKNPLIVLQKKILKKDITIAIIGLGYVGLPLAVEFARNGIKVNGIETSLKKIDAIQKGKSYVGDTDSKVIKELVTTGQLNATHEFNVLKNSDVVVICVPTPLAKTKDPDMSFIMAAADKITQYLHPGQLIILESTTYPGTTEELLLPLFEKSGLKAGVDYGLAFSPERVDPGNKTYTLKNIPKIVGGITLQCRDLAQVFYQIAIDKVIPVSSPRVAEMAKLMENTFRSVNIALANEIALLCHRLGIDVWEVIDAAGTKPYGYMPFYPGPGLGGHCIPVDPLYLSWRAKIEGFESRFIELAKQINSDMPKFVVERIGEALNRKRKPIYGSKVLILGVAYKNDVDDVRESPAFDILQLLADRGAKIAYNDPYVPVLEYDGQKYKSVSLTKTILCSYDCVVILTAHRAFDYDLIVNNSSLIVDTRNALKGYNNKNIIRL